jgi:hypothetical protein
MQQRSTIWVGLPLLLAGSMLISAQAGARDRGPSSRYYERQIETDRPYHGYSGWVGIGPRSLYCDYQRLPNRECTRTSSGKRRCRVTSWTLKQYCY